ncbi:MAG TPA: YIP1 family protein [Vicinamibacterales bacterium]|nr:YIP1 family protein [Vicinamibacterales bacterium]
MVQTAAAIGSDSAAGPRGLAARLVGVLFSPRATYADVAARPRWLGAFLVVYLIVTTVATTFIATEVGRNAVVDQQVTQSEAYGRHLTQEQIDRLETVSKYYVYGTPVLQLVGLTLGSVVVAGIAFAVFNALLGGDATFKQVFAIVAHSGVVLAALSLFTTPLAYARQTLSTATNLGVFFPFLDDSSFAARLLGSIDLVYIWWMVSLAIGLGVLYRKRTGPIATTMIAIYGVIGIVIAAIKTASSGA